MSSLSSKEFLEKLVGENWSSRTFSPGFPGGSAAKSLPASAGSVGWWVQSLGGEEPRERKQQPAPVSLAGKPHGQSNLEGYTVRRVRNSQSQLSNWTLRQHAWPPGRWIPDRFKVLDLRITGWNPHSHAHLATLWLQQTKSQKKRKACFSLQHIH